MLRVMDEHEGKLMNEGRNISRHANVSELKFNLG